MLSWCELNKCTICKIRYSLLTLGSPKIYNFFEKAYITHKAHNIYHIYCGEGTLPTWMALKTNKELGGRLRKGLNI